MKILLVAATLNEIKPFMARYSLVEGFNKFFSNELDILITGVGMVATAYALGKTCCKKQFDLGINAGIAGSFDRQIALGEVAMVTEDCFTELGAEDGEAFLTIEELSLGQSRVRPLTPGQKIGGFRSVKAITVNKVHGNASTIETTIKRWGAELESMEGAAFFYACNQAGFPSIQLRSVSNYVEPRNRESWNIDLAVKNLNEALIKLISELK